MPRQKPLKEVPIKEVPVTAGTSAAYRRKLQKFEEKGYTFKTPDGSEKTFHPVIRTNFGFMVQKVFNRMLGLETRHYSARTPEGWDKLYEVFRMNKSPRQSLIMHFDRDNLDFYIRSRNGVDQEFMIGTWANSQFIGVEVKLI